MVGRAFALLLVGALVASGCGGSDDGADDVASSESVSSTGASSPTSAPEDDETAEEPASDDGEEETPSVPSGASDTATVAIGADTYQFTDALICQTDPDALLVQFKDGEDELLLSTVAGNLVVKAIIDGVRWANPATQVEPEISGNTVVWADVMAGVGPSTSTTEQGRIEVHC